MNRAEDSIRQAEDLRQEAGFLKATVFIYATRNTAVMYHK